MWLRDSSFVAVRDVQITGVTASDGERSAPRSRARRCEMTTLHVREDVLRERDREPTRRSASLQVKTDFPHGLTIQVVERQPVAALAAERRAADPGHRRRRRAARRDRRARPAEPRARRSRRSGPKLTDRRALRALTIAGAAPAELLRRDRRARRRRTRRRRDALNDGPELVFGTDEDARREVDRGGPRAGRELGRRSDLSRPPDSRSGGRRRARSGRRRTDREPNPQPEAENSPTLDP